MVLDQSASSTSMSRASVSQKSKGKVSLLKSDAAGEQSGLFEAG